MKKQVLLFLFTFCLTFYATAQIGFQENVIIDDTYNPKGIRDISIADIDSDGDLDILTASFQGENVYKIAWNENLDNNGVFGVQKNIFTIEISTSSLVDAQAKDIDNDGDIDILFSYGNGGDSFTVAWFDNVDGLGTFSEEQLIGTSDITDIVALDIDNDGDLDVTGNINNSLTRVWYENTTGLGDFGSEQVLANNININKLVFADIDGDGDLDMYDSKETSLDVFYWYERTTLFGEFIEHTIDYPITTLQKFYLVDIDEDNDLDLVRAAGDILLHRNDGSGNFGSEEIIGTGVTLGVLHIEDLDGDGFKDLLVASQYEDEVVWYRSIDGDGNFESSQDLNIETDPLNALFYHDFNGDGDTDILSFSGSDQSSHILKLHKNLDGISNFNGGDIIEQNADMPKSVYSADIDGDGDMDVISIFHGDNEISWYENMDGLGTFSLSHVITTNFTDGLDVHLDDIDGDGDIDVLAVPERALFDPKVVWFENIDGLGNFGSEQIITTAISTATSIYTSDMDGDGDKDVLTSSEFDDKIAWFENLDGQGSFGTENIITVNANGAFSVYAQDMDGDGDMDVLSASKYDDKIAWYENVDGLGDFGDEQIISQNDDGASLVYAIDIDNDGDLDVLSVSENIAKISWYENLDGLGDFGPDNIIDTNGSTFSFGDKTLAVFPMDVDGDGDIDVCSATSRENKISWYENIDGLGSFGTEQIISTDADGANSIFAMDIDNDGDMDIISCSEDDDKIAWYRNIGIVANEINGILSVDLNADGCDASDPTLENIMILTESDSENLATFSLSNGFYQLFPNEGEYTTSITSQLPYYYVSNPTSQTSTFTGVGNVDTIEFCLEPIGLVNDLVVSVYPSFDDPRPGFDTTYRIVYKNIGTTTMSGTVTYEFDDTKLYFVEATESVASQTTNTLTFDYSDLNPFETRIIDVVCSLFTLPTTNLGDILNASATIEPITGDNTPEDNIFLLNQTVIASYDPNDISVLEGEEILLEDADKYLHYIIRFQNTGTASAINVHIENVLDDKLDYTTMQIESLSHTGKVEITNGTMVDFIFDNINLADSTNDEPNSHGFIAYKIKPKSDVTVGDVFYNTADIFFDFNPAITTNTVATEIVENLSVGEFNTNTFSVYPNPTESLLTIKSKVVLNSLTIYDVNGRKLNAIEIKNSALQYQLDVTTLSNGIYFLEIISENAKQTQKFIKK
ncbi:FG-GAP-like repeat-containing protein [Lacinutrix sp. MEBiC02595]